MGVSVSFGKKLVGSRDTTEEMNQKVPVRNGEMKRGSPLDHFELMCVSPSG